MNIFQRNILIFLLLCICVWNKSKIESNNERSEMEFEEKSEYTNRVQGHHFERMLKRIIVNPRNSLLPYGSSFGNKIVPNSDDVSFELIQIKDAL